MSLGVPGRATRWLFLLACLALSACSSATALDARLTAAGRTAQPLNGQSPTQHVDDATECREQVMDDRFYAGAYALCNPLRFQDADGAIRAWHQRFAACLEPRGCAVPMPHPPAAAPR